MPYKKLELNFAELKTKEIIFKFAQHIFGSKSMLKNGDYQDILDWRLVRIDDIEGLPPGSFEPGDITIGRKMERPGAIAPKIHLFSFRRTEHVVAPATAPIEFLED